MKLVLTRHGESQWNLENRFTGWVDVDITDKGRQEAIKGGQTLKELGLTFDVAYTSYQKTCYQNFKPILRRIRFIMDSSTQKLEIKRKTLWSFTRS